MSAPQLSTLMFVHGAGSNADFWHRQQAAFPEAHYLNLPGHTQAQDKSKGAAANLSVYANRQPSSIDAYADWVAEYVEVQRLDNVVLNGHSMGGAITLTLALRRPKWLKAVVLTGTGARLRVLPRLLDLLRTDYAAAVDLIVQESFVLVPEPLSYAQRARLNGTRRQILRTPQAVTRGDYEACDGFDMMDRVGEIAVPTLCIVGEQDTMTPPKYSRYICSKIAGSCLEVIDGAGHMLPMEQPDEYNRRLADFLSSLN